MISFNRHWPTVMSVSLIAIAVFLMVACGPSVSVPESVDTAEAQSSPTPVPTQVTQISEGVYLEIRPDSVETDANGLQVGFTVDGHAYRGDPNASVVIAEYSDFQCPFCTRFFQQTLPALEEDQLANGDAVLVYYDFPLNSIHPQANVAARAARCAGEQGAAAFWAMHDALFTNSDQWSNQGATDAFVRYAEDIGLNSRDFEACISSSRHQDSVQDDLNAGTKLGVTGTPSFFINGQLFVGAQPVSAFNDAITTVGNGGQLASAAPREATQPQPVAVPTPAVTSEDFAADMGDLAAPVTIVEFTDYQCPYCSRHSLETMPAIVSELVETGRIRYILKDFPLDQLHPEARAAAAAVRCAGEQDAYWRMHDIVFSNQAEWAGQAEAVNPLFAGYAADIDLDRSAFGECLSSGRFDDAIQDNLIEGLSLGVSGTPFFFVDGYPLNGARPYEHFQYAVELAEEGRLAEAFRPQPQQQPQQPQPSGPVEVSVDNAFSIGDSDAPITIVEFTDFQCPFCSRHFQETYPQIVEQFVETGVVRYVFKDFPLTSIHPQATEAAEAARCAGDQEAFVEMHDLLFERQQQWSNGNSTEIFVGLAGELDLNADSFRQCLISGKYRSAVELDYQQGLELGVTGTPAFFINGYPVTGAQPFALFEQAVNALLAEEDVPQ